MAADGKQLENLVAFVEERLLPAGFEVRTNERVFNDEGIQIAEFDIEITGKVGSTNFVWLIECRDRPTQGPAPGSWIEQLVGRRTRFGFNKVTAVSTTGFAAGALEFAQTQGIELREVRSLEPSEFSNWLQFGSIHQILRISDLHHARIFIAPDQLPALQQAAADSINSANGNDELLVSSITGERLRPSDLFLGAVQQIPDAFNDVTPDNPKPIQILGQFSIDDCVAIETSMGFVRVGEIEFIGMLRIEEDHIPIANTIEYRSTDTAEPIAQVAAFAPQSIQGMDLSVEFHRMVHSNTTHLVLRRNSGKS